MTLMNGWASLGRSIIWSAKSQVVAYRTNGQDRHGTAWLLMIQA